MNARPLVLFFILTAALVGCRKDVAPLSETAPDSTAPTAAAPEASSREVIVRVQKLGGEGGKQVLNRLTVATPLGDEFTLTEQVGATQFELRGKVTALGAEKFRVHYDYAETSASGQKRLQSTVEMQANTEQQIGQLRADDAMESVVLSLSRP